MIVRQYSHKEQDNAALKPSMFNVFVLGSPVKSIRRKGREGVCVIYSFISQTQRKIISALCGQKHIFS